MHVRLATTTLNEAQNLPALAKGCREMGISSWVILDDLESADGTHKVAKEVFGDMPGRVIRKPWSQFGTLANKRNYLLNTLKSTRKGCDYLFLTASDEPPAGRLPDRLSAPVYGVTVECGEIEFTLPMLIRADTPAYWSGNFHEALVTETQTAPTVEGLRVYRGESTHSKRDHRKYISWLKKHRDEPRWAFYYAQELVNVGERGAAIEAYLRRAQMVGHQEETFFSLYMVGCLMEPLDVEGAILYHTRACNYRPNRPEPYYHLGYLLPLIGLDEQAKHVIATGASLPRCEDVIFVNRHHEAELKRIHAEAA